MIDCDPINRTVHNSGYYVQSSEAFRESSPSAGPSIPFDVISLDNQSLVSELSKYLDSNISEEPGHQRTNGLIRELAIRCQDRGLSLGECKMFVDAISHSLERVKDHQRSENLAHGLARIACQRQHTDAQFIRLMWITASYILKYSQRKSVRDYAYTTLKITAS